MGEARVDALVDRAIGQVTPKNAAAAAARHGRRHGRNGVTSSRQRLSSVLTPRVVVLRDGGIGKSGKAHVIVDRPGPHSKTLEKIRAGCGGVVHNRDAKIASRRGFGDEGVRPSDGRRRASAGGPYATPPREASRVDLGSKSGASPS